MVDGDGDGDGGWQILELRARPVAAATADPTSPGVDHGVCTLSAGCGCECEVIEGGGDGEDAYCFVCFGEGAARSPCACTARWLHPECMLQLIEMGGSLACPVCTVRYPNVVVHEHGVWELTRHGLRATATALCAASLLGSTIALVSAVVRQLTSPGEGPALSGTLGCLMGLSGVLTLPLVGMVLRLVWQYQRGTWRFVAYRVCRRVKIMREVDQEGGREKTWMRMVGCAKQSDRRPRRSHRPSPTSQP